MTMKLKNLLVVVALFGASVAPAQEKPFRFPAGKHGGGELKYVSDLPVLMLAGSPEEMGEQFGILAVKPADLPKLLGSVLKAGGYEVVKPLLFNVSKSMYPQFPAAHAK